MSVAEKVDALSEVPTEALIEALEARGALKTALLNHIDDLETPALVAEMEDRINEPAVIAFFASHAPDDDEEGWGDPRPLDWHGTEDILAELIDRSGGG